MASLYRIHGININASRKLIEIEGGYRAFADRVLGVDSKDNFYRGFIG